MRVYVRYETPNEDGVTRRQRNENLQQPTPPLIIPESGKYIWDWFLELTSIAAPISDGYYRVIPPSEYLAWQQITGNIVYPVEYDIIFSMSAVFCDETNKEIRAKQFEKMESANKGVG